MTSRLLDADKLEAWIAEFRHPGEHAEGTYAFGFNEALTILESYINHEDLSPDRERGGWIPVSERLPEFVSEIPKTYIFSGLRESFDVWVYSQFSGLYGISRYVQYGGCEAHFRNMAYVSHWQLPLPPAPEVPRE